MTIIKILTSKKDIVIDNIIVSFKKGYRGSNCVNQIHLYKHTAAIVLVQMLGIHS